MSFQWREEVGIEPDSHLDRRQANGFAARGGHQPLSSHLKYTLKTYFLFIIKILCKGYFYYNEKLLAKLESVIYNNKVRVISSIGRAGDS